jgi:nucleotide-binding universal stress UspA family protein
MRLSKVLLPVDLSQRSIGAAHYAKALASHFKSEVIIAHVFEFRGAYMVSPEMGVDPEWYEARREEARRVLQDFQTDEFRNLPVRRMLLKGDVAGAIVELAHTEHVDLIVMPTHGYGPFRRFLLGSITAKVLHDADCPVLTGVHIAEAPALVAIHFRSVVCAVDFDAAGERALRWAAQFAAGFQARLTVVHALPDPGAGEAYFLDQNLPIELAKSARGLLEELLKRVGVEAESVIEPGAVADVVRSASTTAAADLVVIGRHESSGLLGRLRANAYAIVRESPCPVVSV